MSTLRNDLLVAATVGLMSSGGCATTGRTLPRSATRLERSGGALQEEARGGGERSGYRSGARELAEEARDFRRTVEDHRSSKEDVRDALGDVSMQYQAMRDEVERSRSRDA